MAKLNKTEAGLIVISDPGADKPLQEIKTQQCVHCGGHFYIQVGSGKVRGWCMNCNGFICGPNCVKCVPTEQMLENMEKGRPIDFKPVQAQVPLCFE